MLHYTDLKKGVLFVKDGEPYEVIESNFSRMQQRKAVVQSKIRNLVSGKIFDITFQASDSFGEAEIEKRTCVFLYEHRREYVFSEAGNQKKRFTLTEEILGEHKKWLRKNTEITAIFFGEKLINFTLPIKMDLCVTDAPPGVQGDRAQSGTKAVTLETGAIVQAPLFIENGDVIRVNTESGEYVERVSKG